MRYSFFWDVTQRRLEVIYLWFGTAPRFHLQGPSSPRTVSLHWVTFQNSKDLSLGPNCTWVLVCSVAGANECDNLASTRTRSSQPVPSRYADWAIPEHEFMVEEWNMSLEHYKNKFLFWRGEGQDQSTSLVTCSPYLLSMLKQKFWKPHYSDQQ